MTRKRYSIYPSQDLDAALAERLVEPPTDTPTEDDTADERAEPLRGRSATITAMVVRYAEIIREHTPLFTPDEWTLIVDSLNGYWTNDNPRLAAHGIALEVADNHQLNAAGQRFNVDGLALAKRIQAMPLVERIAILDVSERFWAGSVREGEDYPALFTRLAGKLAPTGTIEPLGDNRFLVSGQAHDIRHPTLGIVDFSVKRANGAYYATCAHRTKEEEEIEINHEPSMPEEIERINEATDEEIAAWAAEDVRRYYAGELYGDDD